MKDWTLKRWVSEEDETPGFVIAANIFEGVEAVVTTCGRQSGKAKQAFIWVAGAYNFNYHNQEHPLIAFYPGYGSLN